MIDRRLFYQHYGRGMLASGSTQFTHGIMEGYTAFRDIVHFMGGGTNNIGTGWCQLATEGAFQDYHSDKYSRPDAEFRHIWNLSRYENGEVRKMMTIADRITGKWCSFLVPENYLVSLSSRGSGNDSRSKHLQHRIDSSDGVFAYCCETLN